MLLRISFVLFCVLLPNCYTEICHGDGKNCESNCPKPNWYLCRNNKTCIASSFVCDGIYNCPGNDDERDCEKLKLLPTNCNRKFEFTCKNNACIPLDLVCDGHTDCTDESDEIIGCTGMEQHCKGFYCTNTKRCLESHQWVCDGHDDCGDGSDEIDCVSNCNLEDGKYLCKDNSTCILWNKICDDHKDCPDGSDEFESCKNQTACTLKNCNSDCRITSTEGAICFCPKGFKYDSKKNKCYDINECEIYGVCSQMCTNLNGSYKCECAKNYVLQKDGASCSVAGGDPLLLYTTRHSVTGIYLKNRHIYSVAKNLSLVVGVAYDGMNIYWTDIKHQYESIVKSREDGSDQEIILTSGLEAPEDLTIDWLTKNIYFTDHILSHIAVCSNDGHYCLVLINENIHHPRGIVLHPMLGIMFWTDWGDKPMIGKASMDGKNANEFIIKDIHWPNGLAIDIPNERLYWVDAKLGTVESILLNGNDRREILKGILQHPYAIAVFEDRIYWSNWGINKTLSTIESCDKFTGKHHETIIQDRQIFGLHIYHSSMQRKINHSCINSKCSHLCLLSANHSFTCGCPIGMEIGTDQITCKDLSKKQLLYVGVGNNLIQIEHTTFGKHKMSESVSLPIYIHKMEFNQLNGKIFIADNVQHVIYEYDPITKKTYPLISRDLGNITSLSFDCLANNLYWSDSERHTIEVLSLSKRQRAIVSHFPGSDKPISIVVIPETGKLWIALQSELYTHIDMLFLHGRGPHHHIYESNIGNYGIQFLTETGTVFWIDSGAKKIVTSNYSGSSRATFKLLTGNPISMCTINDDIIWSQRGSSHLFWTHISSLSSIKSFDIKKMLYGNMPNEMTVMSTKPLSRKTHNCFHKNGNCSHICVSLGEQNSACLCPQGLVFKDNTNTTCIEALDCEFRCNSGECLTASRRCNGYKECIDGSDEDGCKVEDLKGAKLICKYNEFACHDGIQCISRELICDKHSDCTDKSDELNCENFDYNSNCHKYQFACDNKKCIDLIARCDKYDDCGDGSDEKNCNKKQENSKICGKNMFQCNTGQCISKEWECDGELDCTDGSDEHFKCAPKSCNEGFWKCKLGRCIDTKLLCNGHNDCGDASDEENCDLIKANLTCDVGEDVFGNPLKFQCESDLRLCLNITMKCDGKYDCPQGEDEHDCSDCSIMEFQCKESKKCIKKDFRCDKIVDCPDGSDEIDCKNLNSTSYHYYAIVCPENMFNCNDGFCIEHSQLCNGQIDCSNGNDETRLCKTSCNGNPCHHKCTPSPNGAICSCRNGYQLNGDRKTCSDINECKLYNPCSQICKNTKGSFQCSCYDDFMLRFDKSTCKSVKSEHYILFSSFNQIRKLSKDFLKIMIPINDTRIVGLDVNIEKKMVYFSVKDSNILYEYNLENETLKYIDNIGSPGKISIDWITNNIYFIDTTNSHSIKICHFSEKSSCAFIKKMNLGEIVTAIEVDAINKYIFYSVKQYIPFSLPKSIIYRARLDGSQSKILHKSILVSSIECDIYKKMVFFIDAHSKTIQSISYDGGDATVLIKDNSALKNPLSLSIYESTAFIINAGSSEAVRCKLYADKFCESFDLTVYNADNIVIVASSRQKIMKNICATHSCSFLCIPAEYGPKCICHDGTPEEGVKCSDSDSTSVRLRTAIENVSDSNDTTENNTTLTVCLTLMALIGIGLFGYMFYRRKIGHRQFNINMHFQNPLSRDQVAGNETSSEQIKICRPIQRFFKSGRSSEIVNEDYMASLSGGPSKNVEESETAPVNGFGEFDDNPKSRLVL